MTAVVWDGDRVDEKIDALMQAICKEGGLGAVIWVPHDLKDYQKEETMEVVLSGHSEEDSGGNMTSRKHSSEVMTAGKKKKKEIYISASSSTKSSELLHLKTELGLQTQKLEMVEAKIEDMGKQIRTFGKEGDDAEREVKEQ
ncbi:unnamed protein product [Microthlaspi erraticum]|uniref:Uncharacterized protein n=1 Tax=Microthlaspi erraticum TaxID=1685480 RepID=A0A6D2KUA0_9BRAS|nr:unnamed protein product [Microthlaspi erraticum]